MDDLVALIGAHCSHGLGATLGRVNGAVDVCGVAPWDGIDDRAIIGIDDVHGLGFVNQFSGDVHLHGQIPL